MISGGVAYRQSISPENLGDDRSLYESISCGDESALAALVQKHAPRVQFIIYRIIEGYGEWEDVEELAQDVFFKVWLNIGKYKPGRGSFTKWINMLAKYTALDFRREIIRNRLPTSLDEAREALMDDSSMASLDRVGMEQQKRALKAALEKLPEPKAQLLTWHYLEGKTYEEIAVLTHCQVGTVKSRIYRAVQELKPLI